MSETFTKKNIYDHNGVLLLAKGQKTTNSVIAKLEQRGCYEKKGNLYCDENYGTTTLPFTSAIREKINIRNDYALEYSNKILSSIIFESKTEPWWMYINVLSNYVDWIYTHSIDVAIISLMMGVNLRLNDQELFNIGLGALLHDVGKLLIPKAILTKPGSLNQQEMDLMRQHCELGKSSLEPYSLPKECVDIVIQHHERLDGSGYPKKLKGDEICRNAKIVMIADVIDAVTSGRPYKSTQGMDVALNILRGAKEKYSQELVAVLEKIL